LDSGLDNESNNEVSERIPARNKHTNPKDFEQNGRFAEGNTIGPRFKEGHKPDGEKISASLKKYWSQKNFRKELFEYLTATEIKTRDGKTTNFMNALIDQFKFVMLASDGEVLKAGYEPLTSNDKIHHFFKMIERLTPEEKNLKITSDMPVQITFNSNDKNVL
jgi:hypothetical protein